MKFKELSDIKSQALEIQGDLNIQDCFETNIKQCSEFLKDNTIAPLTQFDEANFNEDINEPVLQVVKGMEA